MKKSTQITNRAYYIFNALTTDYTSPNSFNTLQDVVNKSMQEYLQNEVPDIFASVIRIKNNRKRFIAFANKDLIMFDNIFDEYKRVEKFFIKVCYNEFNNQLKNHSQNHPQNDSQINNGNLTSI
jgi:hypothetical protein